MRGPRISIITVCLNSRMHIKQTIESVLSQDYPDIEYIIIDGGSTDGTLDIIKQYTGISKTVSGPDRGISDAMNKGIGLSTGEIIGIIHSDDYYADKSVVSAAAGAFREPEVKIIYGIQDFVDKDSGEVLLSWGREAEPEEIKKRMYMPHPTMFVRREVYDKAGLFSLDYECAMDYEWALRALNQTRPLFINRRLAVMREMGQSGRNFRLSLAESARALKEHGYYTAYAMTLFRNSIKLALYSLGLKGLIYKAWARNVGPAV